MLTASLQNGTTVQNEDRLFIREAVLPATGWGPWETSVPDMGSRGAPWPPPADVLPPRPVRCDVVVAVGATTFWGHWRRSSGSSEQK